MTRNERQKQCIKHWIEYKGRATIVASVGFGKTKIGTNIIKLMLGKYPNFKVIIVVPTTLLKEQWLKIIDELGFSFNCEVQVINTIITKDWKCDLLIIDEIQMMLAKTYIQIFEKVNYKYVLGLTATFERLDERHKICNKYCPVCDSVPISECLANGWISPYKEYQVLIDVDDLEVYNSYNKEFNEHFSFFGFDWNLANKMVGKDGFKARYALSKEMAPNNETKRKEMYKAITYHATSFYRLLQKRKSFINNHEKKLEIARKIINARPFSKIITFSNSINMAEKIGIGKVYSGRDSKKKGRISIEEFKRESSGVLNTIKKADLGLNIEDISVGIVLGTDSSQSKAIQRLGRTCRSKEDKQAEMFYIIINNSIECKWFLESHKNQPYITIDEKNLDKVLNGEKPDLYSHKIKDFQFRF